jgi:arabinofuranan 3-O-arabinosyltransferase
VGIAEIEAADVPRVAIPRTGALNARCGELAGTVGGRALRLRPAASVADLDAGRPLRVRGCGPEPALAAGTTRLSLPPGALAPYLLRLRAPAPAGAPAAAATGRVVDAGNPSPGARDGIRVDVPDGGRLVFGQAFSAAWRASCDGADLGAPAPVDGYAMSWRLPPGCSVVALRFGPDRAVRLGYLVSAPVLLAILLLLALRRPPDGARADLTPLPAGGRPRRLAPLPAAAAALAVGAGLGFVFALRTAPPIAVAAFLVLRYGVGPRALVAAAGVLLLVAVPVLTLLVPAANRGGYNPEYPVDRIAVHWATVAAVVLLIFALGRVLSTAIRRASPPARAP